MTPVHIPMATSAARSCKLLDDSGASWAGEIFVSARAIFCVLAIAAAVATCGPLPGSPVAKARDSIKNALFDPEAARFRNEENDSLGDVCGEVNSKNRFGAYVGFTKYVYSGASGLIGISSGDPDFAEYYRDVENEFMRDDAFKKIDNACTFAKYWKVYCPEDMKQQEADSIRQCDLWTAGGKKEEKLKAEVGAN
jgi:hypothetical protein